jgi:hypothetical protein
MNGKKAFVALAVTSVLGTASEALSERWQAVRSVNDADELGGRPAEAVDGPGMVSLFARSLGHRADYGSPRLRTS